MTETELPAGLPLGRIEIDFNNTVKAMCAYIWARDSGGYISFDEAIPFVAGLPEFWREPARVMANCGYYSSADEWMKQHVEDKT